MTNEKKPIFNADAAEGYFTDLAVFYRNTANEIFNRDNEGKHASEYRYSAEYQKYLGMQAAMREVLEYFSKFEIGSGNTNADRIRDMTDEELAEWLMEFVKKPPKGSLLDYLRQPEEGGEQT